MNLTLNLFVILLSREILKCEFVLISVFESHNYNAGDITR